MLPGDSKTLDAFDPSKFSVEPNENVEELHFLLNLRGGGAHYVPIVEQVA